MCYNHFRKDGAVIPPLNGVMLHLESVCGSDRGHSLKKRASCFNKTVSNKILPLATL